MFKNYKVSDNNNKNNSLFHQIFLSTHTFIMNNGKKKLVMLCQRPLSD